MLGDVQINRDSTNYIVEEYKRLRQRDQTGAAKSAWRITVRQLESMIRLSEAIARMYCQDEVRSIDWVSQLLLSASTESVCGVSQ